MSFGKILSLALPALGVLAAPPLYVLLDTAVVGHRGAVELAALAAGSTVLSMVTTQLTFLAYGTTARSARRFGEGDRAGAIHEGVQATWIAFLVGLALVAVIHTGAGQFTQWLAADSDIAGAAASWLKVASWGIPLTLMTQAGNGWLRGIQNVRLPLYFVLAGIVPATLILVPMVNRFGVVGSAWANLAGETITSLCFLTALIRHHHGSWRPDWHLIRVQLVLGRDLILRSLSFQVAFLSAAAVAPRVGGAPGLAAHQILLQLWNLISLLLDSLAIAAQALVGAALGSGSREHARTTARSVTVWSTVLASALALIFAAGFRLLPALFTSDLAVLSAIARPWWILVAMIPAGGVVFALDGVLLGAGDATFLRNATMLSVAIGFLPPVWLSLVFQWGLVGIWSGLMAFILCRLAFVSWRYRSGEWEALALTK
ncbi:MATE family efflux transporter [Corynebacterium ulceribovis]|uniref:MATE family efflux transporter n=1 Tax=Corynebacterium ulceribovis TaxID=487732 RepID=UPI00035C99CE|nr:MATE family efflux transporter [Corynebacterium ulceribovis]